MRFAAIIRDFNTLAQTRVLLPLRSQFPLNLCCQNFDLFLVCTVNIEWAWSKNVEIVSSLADISSASNYKLFLEACTGANNTLSVAERSHCFTGNPFLHHQVLHAHVSFNSFPSPHHVQSLGEPLHCLPDPQVQCDQNIVNPVWGGGPA